LPKELPRGGLEDPSRVAPESELMTTELRTCWARPGRGGSASLSPASPRLVGWSSWPRRA